MTRLGLNRDVSLKEPSCCCALRISQNTQSARDWRFRARTSSASARVLTTRAVSLWATRTRPHKVEQVLDAVRFACVLSDQVLASLLLHMLYLEPCLNELMATRPADNKEPT